MALFRKGETLTSAPLFPVSAPTSDFGWYIVVTEGALLQSLLGSLVVEAFSEVFFEGELSLVFLSVLTDLSTFLSSPPDVSRSAFSAAFLPFPA